MGFLTGCGSDTTAEGNGHVYMLNVKGDQKDQYRKLADKFTKKTGIPVDISFMSFDQSVMTLKSELAKPKAPTVFDVDNNDAHSGRTTTQTCLTPPPTRRWKNQNMP